MTYDSGKERVTTMEMEAVKLEQIVMKWYPDMLSFLKQQELDSVIVLRDGLGILEAEDALDIIHHSILEHQSPEVLH